MIYYSKIKMHGKSQQRSPFLVLNYTKVNQFSFKAPVSLISHSKPSSSHFTLTPSDCNVDDQHLLSSSSTLFNFLTQHQSFFLSILHGPTGSFPSLSLTNLMLTFPPHALSLSPLCQSGAFYYLKEPHLE